MWTSMYRTPSSAFRKVTYYGRHSACLKSTVAESEILEHKHAKPFKDMPGPKGIYSIPKIGPIFFFVKPFGRFTGPTFHKLLDHLHEEHGPTFKAELLGTCVVTSSPDGIEAIFRNEGKLPERLELKLMQIYAERNNKEKGMGVTNGPQWQRLRQASQKHMLKVDSASVYIGAQVAVTNDLITRISTMTYTPEEFRDELFQYATESIGVVCFNKRLGFMEPSNKALSPETACYLDAIKQFFQLLGQDTYPRLYTMFPTKLYRDFEKVANDAYGYGRVNIDELLMKVQRQIEDGTFDPDEPNLILQLRAAPNMTVERVNVILLDLLTGGTDSTAKNMELFLRNLAMNPEKQQKLHEEIVDVIGPKGNEMEAHHMSKMIYFRACMKESFRLCFPVAAGTIRALPHDAVIDGYLVPKGTNVLSNSRRLGLDSQYFESSQEYKPERWLRDANTLKREKELHPFALLPFGFGLRNCLGRRFAEQELWLGVTKIIQNFKVSISEADKNNEIHYYTFACTKDPISFTLTPR